MMKKTLLLILFTWVNYSCSPLRSSPNEEKHQMELTIHEMQTGIDDLQHDYNCYQTELEILDEKIKNQDNQLADIKNSSLKAQKTALDALLERLNTLEKKLQHLEEKTSSSTQDIVQLSTHANETTNAFIQYKEKINELEKQIALQNKKFIELGKLKNIIEDIAQLVGSYKLHKVKKGDSLEKIAKEYKISNSQLKKLNKLKNDLIVVDQELKIPTP